MIIYILLVSTLHVCSGVVITGFTVLEAVPAQVTVPEATSIIRALHLPVIQTWLPTSRAPWLPERFPPGMKIGDDRLMWPTRVGVMFLGHPYYDMIQQGIHTHWWWMMTSGMMTTSSSCLPLVAPPSSSDPAWYAPCTPHVWLSYTFWCMFGLHEVLLHIWRQNRIYFLPQDEHLGTLALSLRNKEAPTSKSPFILALHLTHVGLRRRSKATICSYEMICTLLYAI